MRKGALIMAESMEDYKEELALFVSYRQNLSLWGYVAGLAYFDFHYFHAPNCCKD